MKNQYKKNEILNLFKIFISGAVLALLLFTVSVNAQQIINGDFETGDFTAWDVTGPHSANVVQYQGSWSGHIQINYGHASNSGTPNAQWQMVGQSLVLPDVADTLNFYMAVSGSNWHNGGFVWIMDADSVGTYTRLYYTGGGGGNAQTYPWEFHQVNIEAWSGRQVSIYFAGHNSNGYGDHQCNIYFDEISVFPTVFDTIPPTVTVDIPNGGEEWIGGETYDIQWTADDNIGVTADIVYYSLDNGANWSIIASHTGNPQTCEWTVPNMPSTECLVKVLVYDGGNNTSYDESDVVFTILANPNQIFVNNDFETGDFTGWTVTGPHTANVVQYQGSWSGHIHINAGNASGSGTPNDKWQMVGQSVFIPGVADSLNFYMAVSGSSWHDGGFVWIMDADSVGTYTRLYRTGGGGGNAQSYPWEYHQANIEAWAGRQATIYFAGHNSNGYGDHQCDIYFDNISVSPLIPDTIPPNVTVDVPNGGEVWTVGDTKVIEWTAEDDMGISSDSVFYSIDNGSNWIFIAAHSGNPQSSDWFIPNTPSTQCLVKVIVYDGGQNSASDVSNAVFTIAADASPPTVEVNEPNGGEDWGTFEWHNITWTADDNVGVIGDSIYYSIDNGGEWTLIATHTGNPQTYAWQVPNTPSDECLVKVKVFDASGNCTNDISDDNFTITYVEPPPLTYAVVIKQSTYNDPDWQAVADALLARYGGQLFIWENSLNEVQNDVGDFKPSHVGFICEVATTSPSFVQNSVWPFTR
ncbi:MAG: hypothetical protein K8R58_02595, partial [Bacteroidales bacterium]|nr:hypothetical protein [Bacteroidales bacterium]